ncbi:MAG: diguanylate cyclase [Treponemataceae bacterium]|nr:diguanylate cyclase [Treponemataceae bacterium]
MISLKKILLKAIIVLFCITGLFSQTAQTILTKEEIKFVESLPTLTVLLADNDLPFSKYDNHEFSGAIPKYFNLITELTGIKFNFTTEKQRSFVNQKQTIDLVGAARYSSKYGNENYDTTLPYLVSSKLLVSKKYYNNPGKNQTISLGVSSHRSDEKIELKRCFQNQKHMIIQFSDSDEILQSLLQGKIDMGLINQYTIHAFLDRPDYSDLQIETEFIFEDNYCIQIAGLSKNIDGRMLISILNRAILATDPQVMVDFIQEETKNLPAVTRFQYAQQYKWEFFLLILVFFIIFFGVILFSGQTKLFSDLFTTKQMQLETLSTNLNTGIVEIDKKMRILYANQAFLSLIHFTGESSDLIEGREFTEFVAETEKNKFISQIGKLNIPNENTEKHSFSIQIRLQKNDLSTLPVILNASLMQSKNNTQSIYMIIFDNSSQFFTLQKYQNSKKKFDSIIEKTNEIQYEFDFNSGEITVDDNLYKKMGWTFPHKMSNTPFYKLWHLSPQYENQFKNAINTISETGDTIPLKVKLKKTSGIELWVNILLSPVMKDGKISKIFGTIEDIDYEQREQDLIKFKADTDPLTGLYQKDVFEDFCKKFMKKAIHEPGSNAALIFLDMDNFKQVNDVLGHLEGDKAICDTARKLQLIFSQYDVISRFGGDEFCIFVKNIPQETLEDKLNWLVDKMKETYTIDDKSVTVTASVGVSLFPKDGNSYDQLLDCADKAQIESKQKGKNRFTFFSK